MSKKNGRKKGVAFTQDGLSWDVPPDGLSLGFHWVVLHQTSALGVPGNIVLFAVVLSGLSLFYLIFKFF